MNRFASVLDKASGYLFTLGFLTSRLKMIPHALTSGILNLVSLFAYAIGYVAWYVAGVCFPNYPRKRQEWFGFAEFKEQYQIAAILGIIATVMCMIAPPLIVVAAWIYALSNAVWAIGEWHKQHNPPPHDPEYSTAKQSLYFRYAFFATTSSLIAALGATIALLFPPFALATMIATGVVALGITSVALYFLGRATLGKFTPDKVDHSYGKLSEKLSFDLDHKPEPQKEHLSEATADKPSSAKTQQASNDEITEENIDSSNRVIACR